MDEYAVFGAQMTTLQGNRLAAAGLCLKEKVGECESMLQSLEGTAFCTESPQEIDRALAEKLSFLFCGKAIAVGAAVYIEKIHHRVYRTGGVLGRPEEAIEDADSELAQLGDGLWMYTISGGPGWIGFLSQDAAEQLARDTFNQSVVYPAKVNEVYRSLRVLSAKGFVFISDGTGYDSFGLCAAKIGKREFGFIV